jgi:hypothetical protein
MTATINLSVDHHAAIRLLEERRATVPNVLATPTPDVDVLQFTPAGHEIAGVARRNRRATAAAWVDYGFRVIQRREAECDVRGRIPSWTSRANWTTDVRGYFERAGLEEKWRELVRAL